MQLLLVIIITINKNVIIKIRFLISMLDAHKYFLLTKKKVKTGLYAISYKINFGNDN